MAASIKNIFQQPHSILGKCLLGLLVFGICLTEGAQAAPNNLELSLSLLRTTPAAKENVCLSPFSIEEAFAVAGLGAREETAKEIAQAFQFPISDIPGRLREIEDVLESEEKSRHLEFSLANSLFVDKNFELSESFLKSAAALHAEPESMDFRNHPQEARERINEWVEEKTQNKVHELLKPQNVQSTTLLIIVNAVYFQALWKNEFEKAFSRENDFFSNPGKAEKVFFMNQTEEFPYAEKSSYSLISLPYQGEKLSLVILLPKEKNGLESVLESLSAAELEKEILALRRQEVHLSLPRFKMAYDLSLVENLKGLGLSAAFNAGKADFSGIDGSKRLYVSEVRHQAVIEVDERGTEAAAATAISMADGAAAPQAPPKSFHADHPFLFLLRETSTGNILFLGTVRHP